MMNLIDRVRDFFVAVEDKNLMIVDLKTKIIHSISNKEWSKLKKNGDFMVIE